MAVIKRQDKEEWENDLNMLLYQRESSGDQYT